MPINLQIKLLRALSSKKITRIGGKDEIDIDIRIISATKKDLFYEIKNECFREDFYYRINTILLEIPPLRERNKDICILTKYFVKYYEKIYNVKIRKITKDYIKALEKYYFNGNVRELRHIIERSVILAKNYILDINVLPQQIFDNKSKNNILEYNNPNKQSVLDLHEKELIKKVLEKENYNISSSSRILGISRPTLYNKIKEYDISVK
jgi:transcriptional regulator with PAS, ATPase and Fis domain